MKRPNLTFLCKTTYFILQKHDIKKVKISTFQLKYFYYFRVPKNMIIFYFNYSIFFPVI